MMGLSVHKSGAPPGGAQIKSVQKALMIIDVMAAEQRELPLSEITCKVGLPKSTLYSILCTLKDYGYIEQSDANGAYRLGIRFFEMGSLVGRQWKIRAAAKPHLQNLQKELGETVQLGTAFEGEVLFLEKMESGRPFRIVSNAESRQPMHCSALGKVLLAFWTQAQQMAFISAHPLLRMTGQSITDPEKLLAQLAQIRAQGYAVDNREVMDALIGVAAPIFSGDGSVRFAVGVCGLEERFGEERLPHIIRAVQDTAQAISKEAAGMDEKETTSYMP